MLNMWAIVPILDLTAGLWNSSTWSDSSNSDWSTAYSMELANGAFQLFAWSATKFGGISGLDKFA
mgnify:CR=1 FL=1